MAVSYPLTQPDELAAAVSAMSALTLLDVRTSGLSDPLSADAAAEIAALEARGVRVIRERAAFE